jgi:uncharacterized membrane protein HdeD (DUF308 family)
MSPKFYDKSWLQAFKGGFFIILGILAMMQIPGSIKSLAMFFSFFIGLTGFVLIVAPILLKDGKNKIWNLTNGVLNLVFALGLILIIDYPHNQIIWALMLWAIFNAFSELVEAGILLKQSNSFSAIFVIHALLSLLFAYAMYILTSEFTPEKVFNIGLISLVFGLVNELSAFMLNSIKES